MLLAFVVGLFLFLPFPSWQQLVGFITSATVLSFGSGPLVLAAMRRQLPDQERPFRIPGGHIIPFLAFFSSNLIVYWTGWATNSKLFVAVLIGLVFLGVMYLLHQRHDEPYAWSWRAGSWYLPWLAGLALLSWLGDYDGGVGVLHFDTAIPVTLVFSAAVYWLAERVRLDTETVARNVEETRQEASLEDATLGLPRPDILGTASTAGTTRDAGGRPLSGGGPGRGGSALRGDGARVDDVAVADLGPDDLVVGLGRPRRPR